MAWDPDVFCKCANCGNNIYIGETYYKLPCPLNPRATHERMVYTFCESCIDSARDEARFEPLDDDTIADIKGWT